MKLTKQMVDAMSVEELEEARAERAAKFSDLSAQLGMKNKTDASGNRIEGHAYHEWRDRARYALIATQNELALLNAARKKRFVRAQEAKINLLGLDKRDATSLIRAAHGLISKLAREGVELDADEQTINDALKAYLIEHLAEVKS